MTLADRYIGKQILHGTIFAVVILSVIVLLGKTFSLISKVLVEYQAPLPLVVKFFVTFLPFSIIFTLPWGFLASTLLTSGRMSSQNEIISLRMAGLSLWRISLPVIITGLSLSFFSYWLNSTVAPKAKQEYRRILRDFAQKDPKALLQPGAVDQRFKDKRVYIEAREGDSLKGFHLYQLSENNLEPQAYIYASEVDLNLNEESKQFELTLREAIVETVREDGSKEIITAKEIKPWLVDYGVKKKKKFKMSELTSENLRSELQQKDITPEKIQKIQFEISRRFSFSSACFAFAMIGLPLGFQAHRRENSKGMVLSLIIAMAYFGLLTAAESALRNSVSLAYVLLWVPNLVCFGLGLFLIYRSNRH